MENNKIKKIHIATELYISVFLLLGIFMLYRGLYILGAVQLGLCVIMYVLTLSFKIFSKKQINKMIERVTLGVNTNNDSLLSFPLPIALLNEDGNLMWYNTYFRETFPEKVLTELTISDLFTEFDLSLLSSSDESSGFIHEFNYENKTYRVFGNIPQTNSDTGKMLTLIYLEDISKDIDLQKKYIEEKTFECFIMVDNYDELMDSAPSSVVPQLQAEIYRTINDWVSENNGIIVKYEKDKYFIMFEYKYLEGFIKSKFDILSKIRSIETKNSIPASISIGIGMNGENLAENDSYAKSALNMALGRGGDQAVIKDSEQFRFYGAATKEHEKSTRVKARVVSFALSGLISNAENVVVMTHKNADIDGIGAAFGLLRICRIHNTPMAIAMESYDKTVARVFSKLENTEDYNGLVISNEEAQERITENTLVILVDTHRVSMLESPALLTGAKQIVVIDHHRRTEDFVEHPALVYHEPYASSTCEMITEILQYTSNKMSLTKFEAEALYAGIIVDTKNFTFKTGVRTFEAASFLRKQGVDTIAVKTVFQQDLSTYIKRSEIIKNAEIIRDNIAISIAPSNNEITNVVMAQAADELLNIRGIVASFVISETNSVTNISGRSLGGINVQLILEKLGGGGHMTIAGAQLKDTNAENTKILLLEAIDNYYLDNAN